MPISDDNGPTNGEHDSEEDEHLPGEEDDDLAGANEEEAGDEEPEEGYDLPIDVMRVSGRSRPNAVAGAIAGILREHGQVSVQAVGAGAVNQTVKAIAIARLFVQEDGLELICWPELVEITIDDHERTAIRFTVESR